MYRKVKRLFRRWWECRTKKCDYYQHYLAYGPANLTHEGYHAASKKCEEAQKRFTAWLDAHPNPAERIPSHLEQQASFWEKQVRA